eukprot:scaffold99131_cov25-Tisochrysis_lutea.AAC.2
MHASRAHFDELPTRGTFVVCTIADRPAVVCSRYHCCMTVFVVACHSPTMPSSLPRVLPFGDRYHGTGKESFGTRSRAAAVCSKQGGAACFSCHSKTNLDFGDPMRGRASSSAQHNCLAGSPRRFLGAAPQSCVVVAWLVGARQVLVTAAARGTDRGGGEWVEKSSC